MKFSPNDGERVGENDKLNVDKHLFTVKVSVSYYSNNVDQPRTKIVFKK